MRKIYNYRTYIYHIAGVCLFALLFTASCKKKVLAPDSSDTKNKAQYNFVVAGKKYIGENIDSNWDPEWGIVYLGTDEKNEPTGTFTFFIDSLGTREGSTIAYLSSLTVSTVNVLVGTGAEINGKTYVPSGEKDRKPVLQNVEIGVNKRGEDYISGEIGHIFEGKFFLNFTTIKNIITGETVVFKGSFTAIVERPYR